MTDRLTPLDPQRAWQQVLQNERNRAERFAEALAPNKAALFTALDQTGITAVTVTFDGYGDSGQIESVDARRGEMPADLPDIEVILYHPRWDGSDLEARTGGLRQSIEDLCYQLLRETHAGWENNEGAYGDFTFDAAARSIALDYNERFETSEYHGHAW
jgi:hypothetical protein